MQSCNYEFKTIIKCTDNNRMAIGSMDVGVLGISEDEMRKPLLQDDREAEGRLIQWTL